jgi:LemA protein
MTAKKLAIYGIAGVLVLFGIYAAVTYNTLVAKEEKVKYQWTEVQNAYQRRISLIPNLVNVVKGQADFEQTTLQKITEARSRAASINIENGAVKADAYNNLAAAQDSLATAANRLIITMERYPSLKGTDAFAGLQTQLERTEMRIKVARKDFNEAIQGYNGSVRGFPASLVAGLFGFNTLDGFVATGGSTPTEIKF